MSTAACSAGTASRILARGALRSPREQCPPNRRIVLSEGQQAVPHATPRDKENSPVQRAALQGQRADFAEAAAGLMTLRRGLAEGEAAERRAFKSASVASEKAREAQRLAAAEPAVAALEAFHGSQMLGGVALHDVYLFFKRVHG